MLVWKDHYWRAALRMFATQMACTLWPLQSSVPTSCLLTIFKCPLSILSSRRFQQEVSGHCETSRRSADSSTAELCWVNIPSAECISVSYLTCLLNATSFDLWSSIMFRANGCQMSHVAAVRQDNEWGSTAIQNPDPTLNMCVICMNVWPWLVTSVFKCVYLTFQLAS